MHLKDLWYLPACGALFQWHFFPHHRAASSCCVCSLPPPSSFCTICAGFPISAFAVSLQSERTVQGQYNLAVDSEHRQGEFKASRFEEKKRSFFCIGAKREAIRTMCFFFFFFFLFGRYSRMGKEIRRNLTIQY